MIHVIDMIKQSTKCRQFLYRETYYNFKLYMYYLKYLCNITIRLIYVAFHGVTAFLTAELTGVRRSRVGMDDIEIPVRQLNLGDARGRK